MKSQPYYEDWRKDDLKAIQERFKEVREAHKFYILATRLGKNKAADFYFRVMRCCEILLTEQKEMYVQDYGSPVSKASSSRVAQVFIIKK